MEMTNDENYPEDETDLTAEQMDALSAAGEGVELVEVVSLPQGVSIVTMTGNCGGAISTFPVTISGQLISFTPSDDELATSS
jgi:hypothetical protein